MEPAGPDDGEPGWQMFNATVPVPESWRVCFCGLRRASIICQRDDVEDMSVCVYLLRVVSHFWEWKFNQ